jgi:predicted nucleic-acid-binding Zn-ribbon protein
MRVKFNLDAHDHHKGAGKCPVCGKHDHTDTRVAGWVGGAEVKCWEINCPACGTHEVVINRFSDVGKKVHAQALERARVA